MKHLLWFLFLLAASPAWGQGELRQLTPRQAELAPAELGELVQELPRDETKWWTVAVLDGSAASQRLEQQFASDQSLRSLLAQTHYRGYAPGDPIWSARYSQLAGDRYPQIWVMDAGGGVVYKASGAAIPGEGERLAAEIAAAITDYCPSCPRKPQPKKPAPQVEPLPRSPEEDAEPPVNPIPDIRPRAPTPEDAVNLIGFEPIAAIGAVLIALLAVGVALVLRRPGAASSPTTSPTSSLPRGVS